MLFSRIREKVSGFFPSVTEIKRELRQIEWRYALVGAGLTLLCGVISALLSGGFRMYEYLLQPKIAPPRIVFPIAWTVLYIIIGGAAGAVFGAKDRYKESAKYKGLLTFCLMMVCNVIWSPLFFRAGAFFLALLDILAMIALTVLTIGCFRQVWKVTVLPMVIYLAWLCFACYLNFAILLLN